MRKPVLISLGVCFVCLIGVAAIIRMTPFCEDDSECTFQLAPYTYSAVLLVIIAVISAMSSLTLGVIVVGEWLGKKLH